MFAAVRVRGYGKETARPGPPAGGTFRRNADIQWRNGVPWGFFWPAAAWQAAETQIMPQPLSKPQEMVKAVAYFSGGDPWASAVCPDGRGTAMTPPAPRLTPPH